MTRIEWQSPSKQQRRQSLVLAVITRLLLFSLLLAFIAGVIIGIDRAVWWNETEGRQAAIFAYRSLGLAIDRGIDATEAPMGLDFYAPALQAKILFYLKVPYQLCAFAGAYIATLLANLVVYLVAAVSGGRR